MPAKNIYKIPAIEVKSREDLIRILLKNLPVAIFEDAEEVTNPVGRQWNYILTAKLDSSDFGAVILEYREVYFDKPDESQEQIADWLKKAIPSITSWYRGIIKP